MNFVIVTKEDSLIQYVINAETEEEAIEKFDKDVGIGEDWQEWLEVREVSDYLFQYLQHGSWDDDYELLRFDEVYDSLVEVEFSDLNYNLQEELTDLTLDERYYQSTLKVGDNTETYHLAFFPDEQRCCILVESTYFNQRQRVSISYPCWCDCDSVEEGLLKYLAGDVKQVSEHYKFFRH